MGDMNFPDSPALEEGYLDWSWDGEKWVHNGLTGLQSMPANITTANVKLTNPQRSDFETQEDANNYFYESIQNGGGGGEPFPEAPLDGKQYGRQDAGWTEIVHPDVGGGGDVDLSNYYTKPQTDDKFQVKGNYLTEFTEEDPTVPAHVKSISTSDINKWNNPPTGGGGGAVDSVNGKTGAVNLTYADVGAQVAGSYAASNHNHNGVYQPVGSYAASNHNHSGVYAPVSHSHSYAPVSHTHPASSITAGTFGAGNYGISGTLTCTGDLIAYSDERLKENIETASLGVIGQLRGVTYSRKETGDMSAGVIAQDVQKACPELVHQDGDYLAVNYNGLIGYLIEEVKSLRADIEAMREEV